MSTSNVCVRERGCVMCVQMRNVARVCNGPVGRKSPPQHEAAACGDSLVRCGACCGSFLAPSRDSNAGWVAAGGVEAEAVLAWLEVGEGGRPPKGPKGGTGLAARQRRRRCLLLLCTCARSTVTTKCNRVAAPAQCGKHAASRRRRRARGALCACSRRCSSRRWLAPC